MLDVQRGSTAWRYKLLSSAELYAIESDWEDLCERVVEDNVYYTPRYAKALINTVETKAEVQTAAVWADARLIALLPLTLPALRVPYLGTAGGAWQSKYTF